MTSLYNEVQVLNVYIKYGFHMNIATIGKASLVLGVLFTVTMSIVRRILTGKFKREKKEKSSTNESVSASDGLCGPVSDQRILERPSEVSKVQSSPSMNSDSSTDDDSRCERIWHRDINVTMEKHDHPLLSPVDDHHRKLTKKLSSSYRKLRLFNSQIDKIDPFLNKFRKKDIRRKRKQNEILWMQKEIDELDRLCQLYQQQCQAMDRDLDDKQLQLEAIFSSISMATEDELKKKDPISFRKYKNLKSPEEAKSLIEILQNKQRALKDLELLSYKKYLSLSVKIDQKERNNNRFLPVSPYRRNFDTIFQAIRTRVSVADAAKEEDAKLDDDDRETGRNLQNVIVANATARFREMREIVINTEDENPDRGVPTNTAAVEALSTDL